MNTMDKRGLKRKVVMVQLRVLGILGMHEKKAQVLRNSRLFKNYGGGGYWHTLNMPNRPWRISIGNNVNVATNAIILYDLVIGHDAVVAAGAVVTKDVPPYAIVGGNPAKVIGDTRDLLRKRLQTSGYEVENYSYENYFDE